MRSTMASIYLRRVLLVTAIVIGATTLAAAQSGRRGASKPKPPEPPSAPDTKPVDAKSQKAPDWQLLVGVEDPSPLARVPYYFADIVLQECLQRLNEPAGISAKAGSRRMSRGEAIEAAKKETGQYVVWLQVGNEVSDSATAVTNSREEFYLNYYIFEPVTAKIKQSGHVTYSAAKVGNVGVGPPVSARRSAAYYDYVMKEEAREAANRILRAFGVRELPGPR